MAVYQNGVCIEPGQDVVQVTFASYTVPAVTSTGGITTPKPPVAQEFFAPPAIAKPAELPKVVAELPKVVKEVRIPSDKKRKLPRPISQTRPTKIKADPLQMLADIAYKEGERKTVEAPQETKLKALMSEVNIPYDFESSLLGGRIESRQLNVPFLLEQEIGITSFSNEGDFKVEQLRASGSGIRVINFHPMTLTQKGLDQDILNDLQLLDLGIIL